MFNCGKQLNWLTESQTNDKKEEFKDAPARYSMEIKCTPSAEKITLKHRDKSSDLPMLEGLNLPYIEFKEQPPHVS
ncbi:hypothetical protein ACTXT7_007960 [Hymenolepis weldensis]